jgi:transcriptional regulator with XRE-family HTH domain
MIVDNCELKSPPVSQADLARELGIGRAYVNRIISGKVRAGVKPCMEEYRLKLANKPTATILNTKDKLDGLVQLMDKYIKEADENKDKKELLQFVRQASELLGKMGMIEKPTGPQVVVNVDQHLSILVKLILDYVPIEKHDEVMAKCDEYLKTIEVR